MSLANILRFWTCALLAFGLLLARTDAAEGQKAATPPPAKPAAAPEKKAPAPTAKAAAKGDQSDNHVQGVKTSEQKIGTCPHIAARDHNRQF